MTARVQDLAKKGEEGFSENGSGDVFKKRFREIRLEGTEFDFDAEGQLQSKDADGLSFFELKPEFFMPIAAGGFDIRFKAGSTLPISKPLMQSKVTEMYDRLIQLAVGGIAYDPEKLGDELLRVNDLNPGDFKAGDVAPDETEVRLEAQLELATTENRLMMQKQDPTAKVDPETGQSVSGTPFVSPVHTQVHVAFTSSEDFQALDPNDQRVQIFIDHINGELIMQAERQGVSANAEGLPPRPEDAANQNPLAQGQTNGLSNILPAKVQGGGQNPPLI